MKEFIEAKRVEAEQNYEAKCYNYDLCIKSAIEKAAQAGIRTADFHTQGSLAYGEKEVLARYLKSLNCELITAYQNYSWITIVFKF